MKYLNYYSNFFNLIKEDFKSQKLKFISQGYSEAIVDAYLTGKGLTNPNDYSFKDIQQQKFKEAQHDFSDILDDKGNKVFNVATGNDRYDIDKYKTFKEIEIIVDYIRGQRTPKGHFTNLKTDIPPIYENEDVKIWYADTPQEAIQIKGNAPYSWCVCDNSGSNMFYIYRLREGDPAFYFVKKLKDNDPNSPFNFFVIQVLNINRFDPNKKVSYVVTTAENDGDKPMTWEQIIQNAPELKDLKDKFKPVPLSPELREKIKKYQEGLSDADFSKLDWKEKDLYLSVNPRDIGVNQHTLTSYYLSFNKFKVLPEDLKNKYIGFSLGLTNEMFDLIKNNKNLVKRYNDITNRKVSQTGNSLNYTEFMVCTYDMKKLYINRLIWGLTDKQFDMCDDSLKKLYIKNCIKSDSDFAEYCDNYLDFGVEPEYYSVFSNTEYISWYNGFLLTDKQFDWCDNKLKKLYLLKKIENAQVLTEKEENALNFISIKHEVIEKKIKKGSTLTDKEFELCDNDLKKLYIQIKVEIGYDLTDKQFELCDNDLKKLCVQKKIEKNFELTDKEFEWCDDELKKLYVQKMFQNIMRRWLKATDKEFELCDNETKKLYIDYIIYNGYDLTDKQFELCEDELKILYVQYRIRDAYKLRTSLLTSKQFEWCDDNLKKQIIQKTNPFYLTPNQEKWKEENM